MKHRNSRKSQIPSVSKKVYIRPALTAYGGLFQVTKAGSGNCEDNNNGFQHEPTQQHPLCIGVNGTVFVFDPNP